MRLLWSEGRGAYDGKHVRFPEVICDPMPVSRPGPAVLIGAPPNAATFRRVAAWADGWAPVFAAPEVIAEGRKRISQACDAVGRDPDEIEIAAFVKDVSEPTQEAYAEAGADRLVLQLYNHPGTRIQFEDWERHHLSSGSEPPPEPTRTLAVLELMAREAGLHKIGETNR
jgi:alkanesulfonate monooxygenase SsuD/methylene tetrahydromethanopterin reductase-like flavin-dependent oxidoreductase (luciferase family)